MRVSPLKLDDDLTGITYVEKFGTKIRTKERAKTTLRKHQKQLKKKRRWQTKLTQRKETYATYMPSPAWRARRALFLKTYGDRCAICNTRKGITVHHMSYKNVGNELDSDLVVLCGFHHDEFHSLHPTKTDMTRQTLAFIEERRQLLEFPVF